MIFIHVQKKTEKKTKNHKLQLKCGINYMGLKFFVHLEGYIKMQFLA